MMEVTDSADPKPLQDSCCALRIGLNEDPSPSFPETLPDSIDSNGIYNENQLPLVGCLGWIPVEVQEFACGACGEQKAKGQIVVCDGCKGFYDLDCAEMWGWEAKNFDEWVCEKCISREGSEEVQDLRQNMVLDGHAEMNHNGARNKRMKMVENGNIRPWSDLPEALLDLITRRFGMVDYLMFGCVCSSWKLHASAYKQEFMASQAPLILLLSPHARKSCYFYNLFERKMYKALLPSLVGRFCAGITGGYLVMDNKNEKADNPLWLLNPITRHELYFPRSPRRLNRLFLATVPVPRGEVMLIGFSMIPPVLQFCRSNDVNWTTHEIQRRLQFWVLVDGAFFKGKLYFINDVGRMFQFDQSSPPYYIELGIQRIPYPTKKMRLVASDEQLFVIVTSIDEPYRVYVLNFPMKLWITVHSLGDQALFMGHRYHIGTSGSCIKIKWGEGCQRAHNCILDVGYPCSEKFTVHHLGGKFHREVKIKPSNGVPTSYIDSAFWYFPHLASSVDFLSQ
ncbi:hypothetical protein L6164_005889 [Bauhinia variegata]|uniref:Uncharacterized protein n=1 Tax=Bauhinia variegata TaxID=167791 RepID=A0ACB9PSS1_BAUVA|nr:hypothetical protein L6164_005889 [Bauhinia variegata]